MTYDARMGISEAEDMEMLSLAETLEVRRGVTETLRVAPIPNGWRLEGGTSMPEVNGIEIDTLARLVRTKFGELGDFKVVEANDDRAFRMLEVTPTPK